MGHRTGAISALTLALLLATLAGCRTRLGGGDAAEVSSLAKRVTELEREVQLQTLRADEAEAKLAANPRISDPITRATPVLAGIEIDRLSGPTPADAASFPVFIRTLDGRGRFIQVVGQLEVEAFVASDATNAPPVRVGSATLGPLDVREAYRSGVMGTHYRVEIAADPQFLSAPTFRGGLSRYDLRIVARFDDALTSRRHEATATIGARDRTTQPLTK